MIEILLNKDFSREEMDTKLSVKRSAVLSIDELITRWGLPSEAKAFDPAHAVSYRTWLAIANYVAYHDSRVLNALFQGIEFPDSKFDEGAVSFPATLEGVMTPETKAKYAHLRQNARHYGSMQTRLRLFQNIVDAMGDPCANFRVGRNIRVNPDMGALKSTFQTGAKGLLKILGVNPAKILEQRMPHVNRALNTFLDTRVVQYGHNFMDVRVEYFNPEDVSAEGDHYTLGTILGGLENIGAYTEITIRALQTPFEEEREGVKEKLNETGVKYVFKGYHRNPDSPVFLYRYEFSEQAQFLRRLARAVGDVARRGLPSRLTRAELRAEEERRRLLGQEEELDTRAKREYEAKITAMEAQLAEEQARAETAEARARVVEAQAAAQKLRGENSALSRELSAELEQREQHRGLAHDIKGEATKTIATLLPRVREYLREEMSYAEQLKIPQDVVGYDGSDSNSYVDPLIHFITTVAEGSSLDTTIQEDAYIVLSSVSQIKSARGIMGTEAAKEEFEDITIYEAVDKVVRDVRGMNQTPVTLETAIPQDLKVRANRRQFVNCMTCLVDNAVYASPGGRVSITGDYENESTHLSIEQTGILPLEIAAKLNLGQAKSSRLESGGNGVGARTSYLVVKEHKGELEFSSLGEKGGRTELWLYTSGPQR